MISSGRVVLVVFSLVHCCTAEPIKDECIDGTCMGLSATASTMLQLQSSKNKQVANVEQQFELAAAKKIAERVANQTKLAVASASKRQAQKKEKMKKTQMQKRALAATSRKHRQSIQKGKQSRRLPKAPAQAATQQKTNDGSDDATLPPVTQAVCASEGDFMPDRAMSGWCDMQTTPSRDECWNEGCMPYDAGEGAHFCYCMNKDPCEALGGVFEGPTCEEEMRYWEIEAMEAVAASGTCDNVSASWGGSIAEAMGWMAQQCCENYPATICDPEARLTMPCKDEGDFVPAAFVYGMCEYNTVPERGPCTEAGCSFWEDESINSTYRSCHCETQTQCDAVQGRFTGYTCAQQAGDHSMGQEGGLLRQAAEQGTCDGLELSWGETLENWVRHPATNCCISSPANVCNPNARLMTPCKDDADFDGEAALHEWCEMGTKPTREMCEDARCSYWSDEWNEECHCDNEAGCTQVYGTYRRQTCANEVHDWDGGIHASLQEAQDAGTCENQSLDWGETLPDFLRWPAEKCCRSYPATLCEPDAKIMHPCIHDEDFKPEANMNEWCDYGSIVEPAHETCEDAGFCHCHKPDACAHFGGQVRGETCEANAHQRGDIRQLLKEAHEKGNCEDLATPWGQPLVDEIRHTARKCCTSYPSTLCGELDDQ